MKTNWNVWTRLPGGEWIQRNEKPIDVQDAAAMAENLDREAAGQDVLQLPAGSVPSSDPELQRIAAKPRKQRRK